MNFKNRFKKFGFSLMEILIAVFIVAILAVATMPIINKQLSKTHEYSYYLAYNTVEKMAGQIVALGDPEDNTAYVSPDSTLIVKNNKGSFLDKIASFKKSNPFKNAFDTLATKFTNTQVYILSRFTPKAVAATISTPVEREFGYWDSASYDEIWLGYQVCANGRHGHFAISKGASEEVDEETGETVTVTSTTYYTENDFNNCIGYNKAGMGEDQTQKNQVIIDLLSGEYSSFCNTETNATYFANYIKNQNSSGDEPNASEFCLNAFKQKCAGSKTLNGVSHTVSVNFIAEDEGDYEDEDDEEDDEGNIPVGEELQEGYNSVSPGTCLVKSNYNHISYAEDENQHTVSRPTFALSWCTDNGYINMTNNGYYSVPTTIDCQCKNASYVVSTNHEKICVEKCSSSIELPYARYNKKPDGSIDFLGRSCCSTDFNESENKCCPEKSMYNPSSGKCECVSGYKMNAAQTQCVLDYCPAGSHKTDDGVCVVNPPIIKANRFCEEITKHWNISSSSCNAFSSVDGFNANTDVYIAAMSKNNSTYLSANSKIGAFKNITPHIEFANGMKMWILGDKAASIPGLTYFNSSVSIRPNQNMCSKKVMTEHTAIACYNAGGYFCQSENTCLLLEENSKATLRDARNCCAAPDMSTLQEAAEAAGKNWKEDPAAYAISGFTVFVDIDADKGEGTLWEDVFPFYVTTDGVVYPAYPLDAPKGKDSPHDLLYNGGNSDTLLPVDVYYYKSTDESRQRKVAYSSVSYARGVCSARKVSRYSPYCLNLGEKFVGGDGLNSSNCPTSGGCTSPTKLNGTPYINIDGKESRNPCDHYNCFVAVRRKLKSF